MLLRRSGILPLHLYRAQRTHQPHLRTFATSLPTATWADIEEHDITIIGGGPAGLTLAAALANSTSINSTHKITLIESSNLSKNVKAWDPKKGREWSNRVSSITNENRLLLDRIGVLKHIDLSRTRQLKEMQVWDGISDARIEFDLPFSAAPPPTQSQLENEGVISDNERVMGMATMMENLNLQRGALRRIEEMQSAEGVSGIEVIEGKKVEGIESDDAERGGWPIVSIEGGRKLRSRLLIGADGFNSPVRLYSSIESFGWNYDAWGLVGTLHLGEGEGDLHGSGDMHTAYQRFLPQGPIAFLPLSENTASLVWSTTPSLARRIKTLPYDILPELINCAFQAPYESFLPILDLLNSPLFATSTPPSSPPSPEALSELSSLLASLTTSLNDPLNPNSSYDPFSTPLHPPSISSLSPNSVQSFPLKLSHVDSYLGLPSNGLDRRTVLVGDAAHTVHPLAGQGLNSGLGDIVSLVKVLESVVEGGGDVGSYLALQPYPRERYFSNHLLLSTCDHLASLYSSISAPIVSLRSTGLEVVNELEGLKNFFMRRAGAGMGMVGGRGKRESVWSGVGGALEGGLKGVEVAKGLVGVVGGLVRNGLERAVRR